MKGTQKPSEALAALATFEAKLSKVEEDRANMVKAKGALEMAEPIFTASHASKLNIAMEELLDLKGERNFILFCNFFKRSTGQILSNPVFLGKRDTVQH